MGELEKLRKENRKLKTLLAAANELLAKTKGLLIKKTRPSKRMKKSTSPSKMAR